VVSPFINLLVLFTSEEIDPRRYVTWVAEQPR
jgi:hypothetical protein